MRLLLEKKVRGFLEGHPRGEANREKESDEQERKRRAREAYSEKFKAGKEARAKKAKSLRRQLSVSKRTSRMATSRSNKALKTHANITEPPKPKAPKPMVTDTGMFGDLVEEVRWLFEARSKAQQARGEVAMMHRTQGVGQLSKLANDPKWMSAAGKRVLVAREKGGSQADVTAMRRMLRKAPGGRK